MEYMVSLALLRLLKDNHSCSENTSIKKDTGYLLISGVAIDSS